MILMIEMMIKTISTIIISIVRITISIKCTIGREYAHTAGDELPTTTNMIILFYYDTYDHNDDKVKFDVKLTFILLAIKYT